ncbi:hypothetical protein BC628DRAFT_923457 [Trametes gibbosa]|nr:hypothetical protein BC628DRAFT_923457 [Trametes gibbosa]
MARIRAHRAAPRSTRLRDLPPIRVRSPPTLQHHELVFVLRPTLRVRVRARARIRCTSTKTLHLQKMCHWPSTRRERASSTFVQHAHSLFILFSLRVHPSPSPSPSLRARTQALADHPPPTTPSRARARLALTTRPGPARTRHRVPQNSADLPVTPSFADARNSQLATAGGRGTPSRPPVPAHHHPVCRPRPVPALPFTRTPRTRGTRGARGGVCAPLPTERSRTPPRYAQSRDRHRRGRAPQTARI